MSVLFPKVNKPRQWDYRPIYYDPKKDEREKKLAKLRAQRENGEQTTEHAHGLHRGSFREAKDGNRSSYVTDARKGSRLAFWIALFIMLVAFVWVLT